MGSDSIISAIALGASLLLFAIASLAEAGIASVRRDSLQRMVADAVPRASILEHLQASPMGPTGALLLAMSISMAAALLSSAALVTRRLEVDWVAVALVAAATLLFLGVVRSISQAYGAAHGERIALAAAPGVRALAWLLIPVLALQKAAARGTLMARPKDTDSDADAAIPDFNIRLDPDGEPIDERESRMIRGVLQLDKRIAREIMTPRVDMMTADLGTTIPELAALMITSGHSRIPIYEGDLDKLVGIAYARDVIRRLLDGKDSSAADFEPRDRPALLIPESKPLGELLSEFQEQQVHMAIVVDEYGGVSGLVTIEDLLEEIVGEIRDEFDAEEPEIETIDENVFMMDARVSIDQLNEVLRVSVAGDDFDTVGGFVYHRLGKIPSPGDAVEYDGVSIEVISTVGRRLKQLKVSRCEAQETRPR